MSAPLTPEERIGRGVRTIGDLCSGKLRWEMRVPAEPDHDPDLILTDALVAARELLDAERAGAGRLRERIEALIARLPGEAWRETYDNGGPRINGRREEDQPMVIDLDGVLAQLRALDAEPGQPR